MRESEEEELSGRTHGNHGTGVSSVTVPVETQDPSLTTQLVSLQFSAQREIGAKVRAAKR